MLLLTFFPETLNADGSGYSFFGVSIILFLITFIFTIFSMFQECLRCSADILDFVGIAFVLSKIPGKGHSKLLSCAVGWASAEIILSNGLQLWKARGAEFSWIYTLKSLESNILLINTVTTTVLLWLFSRNDLIRKPIVVFLLSIIAFKNVWLDLTLQMLSMGAMGTLLAKGLVSIFGFGLPTLFIYAGMSQSVGF
jgi:Predicted membrane protein (DUF2053)